MGIEIERGLGRIDVNSRELIREVSQSEGFRMLESRRALGFDAPHNETGTTLASATVRSSQAAPPHDAGAVRMDQGAWAPRLRSRVRLSATPKRHLTDASLAIAVLGATPERLLGSEIEWAGFLLESMVVHDLRVLAGPQRAQVHFYQDNKGLEIDAIVERRDGRWLGVEVKLGVSQVDAAAANLLAMHDKLDDERRLQRPARRRR